MTEITIISGFLGAGKTTLIKKLLEEVFQGEKIVLIENEFGEIGIDGGFLKEAGIQVNEMNSGCICCSLVGDFGTALKEVLDTYAPDRILIIDGGFLKEAGIQVNEMNSGCICCSLVGDFGTALKEVLDTYAPDRILIEPSGVGKLSDVVKAVENVAGSMDVHIDSSIVVVDGKKCRMYMKNFGEFFNNQVEHAGTIVLSRTQSMTEEKLAGAVELLRSRNAQATMITTPWDELDGEKILEAMRHAELSMEEHDHHHDHDHDHHEHGKDCTCGCHDHDHEYHHDHEHNHDHHEHGEGCTCGCHDHDHDHHHHHADEVFTSWGAETPRRYSAEELDTILEELGSSEKYGVILRAKGILQNTDGSWMQFDFVPEEHEVRQGSTDYTGRLCVIGSGLNEEALKELFHL